MGYHAGKEEGRPHTAAFFCHPHIIKDSADTLEMKEKDGHLYIEYEGASFRFEKEGSESAVSSGSASAEAATFRWRSAICRPEKR